MNKSKSDVTFWREGLLTRVSYVYAGIFLATVLFSVFLQRITALFWFGVALGLAYLASVILSRRGASYRVRAWTMIVALVVASVVFYLYAGLNPGPVLACALCLVLTTLLLGRRALLAVLLLMVVFLIGITISMWSGLWSGPLPAVAGVPVPNVWLQTTIVSAFFWAGIGFSVLYVVNALEQNVKRLQEKELQRRNAENARREAEAMAIQSQKLESLGQLAAGIAHDFNNALLVLQGWTDVLKDTDSPELQEQANQAINQAIDHSKNLTTQLLTFGRKQMMSPRYLPLDQIVEGTARTLSRVVPSAITLHIAAKPSGFVFADESQLEQLLFNLVINAGDALPDGGEIHVRSRKTDGVEFEDLPLADEHHWVVLEVEDNGEGMTEEIKGRIFEPFFTTKKVGKGSGLGLATVFGIVKQSKAHIRVWSEPDKGTRFTILFPSVEVAPQTDQYKARKEVLSHHNGRVLVLEDDPLARDFIVFALTRENFNVIVAADGDEALNLIGDQSEPIDLLNTDAMFPGAPLNKVIATFEKFNPKGRVLICSGFVPDDIAMQGLESGRYEYLPKPCTAEQLKAKIATILA